MKCLVKECPNEDTGGAFDGSVCVPCAHVLMGFSVAPGDVAVARVLASVMHSAGISAIRKERP